jgi:transposase-like protein
MTHYSEEFRSSVAARLLPPNSARIADIVKETGVPKDTLYDWRARYRNKQGLSPSSCKSSNQYSADDKLAVIFETAALNETELSEYCRRKGLYPVQIKSWKTSILQGLMSEPSKVDREHNQKQVKTIQRLEKDLARKEKALAEVAALLVLQKKFQSLMEASEAD